MRKSNMRPLLTMKSKSIFSALVLTLLASISLFQGSAKAHHEVNVTPFVNKTVKGPVQGVTILKNTSGGESGVVVMKWGNSYFGSSYNCSTLSDRQFDVVLAAKVNNKTLNVIRKKDPGTDKYRCIREVGIY